MSIEEHQLQRPQVVSAHVCGATIALLLGGATSAAAQAPPEQAQGRGDTADRPAISLAKNGLVFRSDDGDVTLRIAGRLHLDAGAAGSNSGAFDSSFQTDIVRRGFVEGYVTLADKVEVVFQYDTAALNPQPIQDAGVSYRVNDHVMVSVGALKEPMGFDQLTSDNDTLFVERALSTALTPGRNFGGLIGLNGARWSLVTGVWGGDPNTGLADEGVSGTARATFAPILDGRRVLHLGASASYRALDRGSREYAFESTVLSTPETALIPVDSALVNTGPIAGARAIARVGLEAAYQQHGIRLQGEANGQTVRRDAAPDATFSSWYVEAGWTFDSNGRAYHIRPPYGSEYAEFGGVQLRDDQRLSRGGAGIVEGALRFSEIDLFSRRLNGGKERNLTAGLNWYPEPNLKFAANYIRANASSSLNDDRAIDADIVDVRTQLFW